MAIPNDPITGAAVRLRASALQSPDLCAWCLGAGSYLEALESDRTHEYLPVVCERCSGSGHTTTR